MRLCETTAGITNPVGYAPRTDQGANMVTQLGELARLCDNLANSHGRVNRHERVTVEFVVAE
jgi:hypothetical protein